MVITIAREVKFSNPKYEHLRVVETTLPCTGEKIMNGKPVCRGAGDSHLSRSMRARSPHVLFPVASDQFQPCIFHHFRVFSGSPAGSDQIAACHEGIRAGVEDP